MSPSKFQLDPVAREKVFRNKILPRQLDLSASCEQPTITFLAGQPGAGKTNIGNAILNTFGAVGAVIVDYDQLKTAHPAYAHLQRTEQLNTYPHLRNDTREWWQAGIDWLVHNKRNIIIETTLAEAIFFDDPLVKAQQHGYTSELVIMAVPGPLSRIGILARYQNQKEQLGSGRLTPEENHNIAYTNLSTGLARVEHQHLVDVLMVTTRSTPEFTNIRRPNNQWEVAPLAHQHFTHLRNKQLDRGTATHALHQLDQLQQKLGTNPAAQRIPEIRTDLLKQCPPGIQTFNAFTQHPHTTDLDQLGDAIINLRAEQPIDLDRSVRQTRSN